MWAINLLWLLKTPTAPIPEPLQVTIRELAEAGIGLVQKVARWLLERAGEQRGPEARQATTTESMFRSVRGPKGGKAAGFRAGLFSVIRPKPAKFQGWAAFLRLTEVLAVAILMICSLTTEVSAATVRDREVGSSNLLAPTCRK